MNAMQQAVILVGHGGIPKNLPYEFVMRLKRLESQRRATGAAPTTEELELNDKIRHWPRTPENDPYRAGLELLATHLRPRLNGVLFTLAYNEFCAPTLAQAVREVVAAGATDITVLSSMLTPGGSHAEIEIPEEIHHLQAALPEVTLRYAWPFDLTLVAGMLAEHMRRFIG